MNPSDRTLQEDSVPDDPGDRSDRQDVAEPVAEPVAAAPSSAGESAPLVVAEFLPDESLRVPRARPKGPPGPGTMEACGWAAGFVMAQIVCVMAVIIVMVLWLTITRAAAGRPVDPQTILKPDDLPMVEIMGGMDLLFVPLTLLAAALRLLPAPARKLGLKPLSAIHIALTALIMIPLSVLCTTLYVGVDFLWQYLVRQTPALGGLNELSAIEMVQQMAESASFPLLVLVIAVAPALSEEVIFRGVIGRGLLARRGVVSGVLLTSVLFGIVHVHPVHAAAVIPIGIVLHVLHLQTRSLWAPVLLHFLNNAWSTFVTKFPQLTGSVGDEQSLPSWPLIFLAGVAVGCLLWLLHQTRIRYVLPDGTTWSPGYVTIEAPPPELDARRTMHRPTALSVCCAVLSVCLFAGVLVWV